MRLADVLNLHPGKEADAATIVSGIDAAQAKRGGLLDAAKQADAERAAGLLTLDDKVLVKLEQDAAQARLAADRIEALLPDMRADLASARGREKLEELRTEHARVQEAIADLIKWQGTDCNVMTQALIRGMKAETVARIAIGDFEAHVHDAYRLQYVEDAGPLGLPMPKLPDTTPSMLLLTLALGVARK